MSFFSPGDLPPEVIYRAKGVGDRADANAIEHTIVLAGEETGGGLSITEFVIPPGHLGPPAHRHRSHDEVFFLVEGRIDYHAEGNSFTAEPGGTLFVPRGAAHAFSNTSDEPARVLDLFTPAGYERYFVEIADLITSTGQVTIEDVRAIMAKYDTELLGPPGQPIPARQL